MTLRRRDVLAAAGAGGTLALLTSPLTGVATTAAAHASQGGAVNDCNFPIGPGGWKPQTLPAPDDFDPASHTKIDVTFWSDQLAEHGLFLAMLLPGAEAGNLRRQSLEFQRTFTQHVAQVQTATIDSTNYQDVNAQTAELVKPFRDFKLVLEEALRTGQVRGLVYPSFAAHIAAEADHFLLRLQTLNAGTVEFDLAELVPFWARIMGEHAHFAAQLLDPVHEPTLIAQARSLAATFASLGASGDHAGLAAAAELILDFKEATEEGVWSGEIQSIIHPALADHIRREAIKFINELHRTLP